MGRYLDESDLARQNTKRFSRQKLAHYPSINSRGSVSKARSAQVDAPYH